MNRFISLIVLAVLALALGLGLLMRHTRALDQQKQDLAAIVTYSNNLKQTSLRLDEAQGVIANLEKDVTARSRTIGSLSNELLVTSNTLTSTAGDLGAARKAIQEAQEEVARRDARIGALQAENNNLDQRAAELTNAIVGLNTQIVETQRKLATAEGDKAFLETQLKRLMGEKAELEKKFNDLEVLRAQIKQLKEDLVIARRVEWVRRGLFYDPSIKGAQRLMEKSDLTPAPPAPDYYLNVEVNSDGSARVIPRSTNAPAAKTPATNAPASK
jgi:septal ring factor EnvC (AmiA/AmiB activator)